MPAEVRQQHDHYSIEVDEEFVDQASDLPFTYVLASDLDEAKDWIAKQ